MSGWKRPALLAFVLGCTASLLTAGRLVPRLVLPVTLYATFVPLCEIGALAVTARRRKMPFGQLVDRYFEGHIAWMMWLVAFGALWAMMPAKEIWYTLAVMVFAWSAFVDWRFFREALERSPRRAGRDLAVQRALAWGVGLLIFVAPAGWQVVISWLGLG